MRIKVTCLKCGYKIEENIEVEVEANKFAEALRFLHQQEQEHHHPEVNDSFKWRVGWEGLPSQVT